LDSGLALMLLQASKGKRQSDQICQVIAAGVKHRIALRAVKRAGPRTSLNATPRPPPPAPENAGLPPTPAGRSARRKAAKSNDAAPPTTSVPTPPNVLRPPTRNPRELTASEVKAAVDRAVARAAKKTSG